MKFVTVVAVLGIVVLAAAGAFGRRMGRFFAVDVAVTCQLIAEAIARVASWRMPRAHRDRYEREWLAELDALRQERENEAALSLILFAVRIFVRARKTARAARQATAPSAPDPAPTDDGPDDDVLDYLRSDPRLLLWDEMLADAAYEERAIRKHARLRHSLYERLNARPVQRIRVIRLEDLTKIDETEEGTDA